MSGCAGRVDPPRDECWAFPLPDPDGSDRILIGTMDAYAGYGRHNVPQVRLFWREFGVLIGQGQTSGRRKDRPLPPGQGPHLDYPPPSRPAGPSPAASSKAPAATWSKTGGTSRPRRMSTRVRNAIATNAVITVMIATAGGAGRLAQHRAASVFDSGSRAERTGLRQRRRGSGDGGIGGGPEVRY
jgi:hypothetical protein